MAWIKRNLAFVIGGVVALGLLGAAGFYIYQSYSANVAARDKLDETYNTLQQLIQKTPSPGNDKVNNIEIAKDQQKQLLEWMASVTPNYFQPIAAIPANLGPNSDSALFRSALATTIKQMQDDSSAASVGLSPNYGFSFDAYRNQLNLSQDSLAPLSDQLGEIKTIVGILLASRINDLDNIQRLRVSDNDASGPQADYLDDHAITNDLAILTPYAVTFRSFTPELAQVLAGFANSKNAFIVKSVTVTPAGPAGADSQAGGPNNNMMPPPGGPGMMPPPERQGMFPNQPPPQSKGGLQTILKEQLLRVTLQVEIVKLLPKK